MLGVVEVLCQSWEKSERGWGVRPNGYSLHSNDAARTTYVKAYWDRMPCYVPEEYSRPVGNSFPVYVRADVGEKLSKMDGMRFFVGDPKVNEVIEVPN